MGIKQYLPILRVLVGTPLIILSFSLPWGFFAGNEFNPINCFRPFCRYLSDHYIFRLKDKAYYPDPLHIFIEEVKLRNLAVPADKTGPKNQIMFVIQGFATVFSIILSLLPITWIQLVAYMGLLTTTFAYAANLNYFQKISYFQLPIGVYFALGVSLILISSIVYFAPSPSNNDPFQRLLNQKMREMENEEKKKVLQDGNEAQPKTKAD